MTDRTVAGDAPKDFIHVYTYGAGWRDQPSTWPAFIAKVGHKWYPAESVTEQLMTRIGQILGISMAESCLVRSHEQIRFLSRYFLVGDESLVHGAQILSGYLEDETFVDVVAQQALESELFTFQVLEEAIRTRFPEHANGILIDFVRMIGFDALVGNQDRHLYNWGAIVDPRDRHPPRFSPVFDTARGLFWNIPEGRLGKYSVAPTMKKYVEAGRPQIGWDGLEKPNHFALVRQIASRDPTYRRALGGLTKAWPEKELRSILGAEFADLLSAERRRTILACISLRFELFAKAIE